MHGNIKVTGSTIHIVGRELTATEKADTAVTHRPGPMAGPVVHDAALESHAMRRLLRGREGNACLSVQAGDELGELYVAIQFEGPVDTDHGEPDLCMAGQNDLLQDAAGWIADVLGALDAEYEAEIVAQPCPKAGQALALQKVVVGLQHRRRVGPNA